MDIDTNSDADMNGSELNTLGDEAPVLPIIWLRKTYAKSNSSKSYKKAPL